MSDDNSVVVALIDVSSNDLPLLLVGRAEHLHTYRYVAHLENGFDDLVPFVFQIFVSRAYENLVLRACVHCSFPESQFSNRAIVTSRVLPHVRPGRARWSIVCGCSTSPSRAPGGVPSLPRGAGRGGWHNVKHDSVKPATAQTTVNLAGPPPYQAAVGGSNL